MDAQVETLARKIVDEAGKWVVVDFESLWADVRKAPSARLLVAIAGPPGSGKTTLAEPLLKRVNELSGGDNAICVSLDGWHLSRAELDRLPDPKEAHWRRGAAFTFDSEKYLEFVKSLRTDHPSIPFFTFDHAKKDPAPAPYPILQNHKIIIIEGLYTLLDTPIWRDAAEMMDIRIWIEVDREEARRRVIQRNFDAGICGTLEDTVNRVDASDMINGEMVREHRLEPTDVVVSIPDARE